MSNPPRGLLGTAFVASLSREYFFTILYAFSSRLNFYLLHICREDEAVDEGEEDTIIYLRMYLFFRGSDGLEGGGVCGGPRITHCSTSSSVLVFLRKEEVEEDASRGDMGDKRNLVVASSGM